MRKLAIVITFLSFCLEITAIQAQAIKKKMSRNINMTGYDNYGPAISGDGNSMVYLSNFTNEGTMAFMYTKKLNASAWKDPEELPRIVNIPHLTYLNGYCLNFDGSEFYFTFRKSGGLGGYDLWMVKRQENGWGSAQNLGSPLNSSLNDGSPSISSDGKELYFMACETMDNEAASGCKIMMSTRSSIKSKWKAPVTLSAVINQGSSMSPNILADGETLMYLSDHEGSPAWFMSRMEEGDWTEPQKMDFISYNGERNISIPAKGRYLYHDVKGERGTIIEGLLIPDQFKPKDVLRLIGKVNSSTGGTMKVYDVDSRERIIFQSLEAGESYDFVLKEGQIYDVSFDNNDPQILPVSELFDLMELRFSTRQKWDVNPEVLMTGDSLEMDVLILDTTALDISDKSIYELRRLTRFLTKSEGKYEINIMHYPLDTAKIIEPILEMDTIAYINEEYMEEDMGSDSTMLYNEIDSLSNEQMDSVIVEEPEPVPVVPTLAEILATMLTKKLTDKKVPEERAVVNGVTVPIKELKGNEEHANTIIVYLKKVSD